MRKGLLILGVFFAIATIGGFIQSNIPAAIAMLLLSIVSFWRASKSKTKIAWEIGGFFFTFLASGGIITIAKEGLYFPNPHLFLFSVAATIVCFYMCDRKPSEKQSEAKTNSNSATQISSMNVYSGSNSATQKSSIVVPQTSTQKYNNESTYDRLKRLCNPVNFMENYNKEKVEIANQIYSKLMDSNFDVEEIATEAEKRLGIQLVDTFQIEDLKDKLHPKNFMDPYDAQKISLANELYSRIIDNITYSEFVILKNDAKPILDLYTTTKVDLGLVDLGLSVTWATCNVGANFPQEYGAYYTYENALNLEKDGKRLPSPSEFQELEANCTWTWTEEKGVNGYKVTSRKNGNSIFLPACHKEGPCGGYWSSSARDYGYYACCLYFGSDYVDTYDSNRDDGQSVRLVQDVK